MQRKSIRFEPDPNTLVYVKRILDANLKKEIDCIGLVHTEAGRGFGSVLLKASAPSEGDVCIVKVGELSSLRAKVVYVREITAQAVECGFEYLE